MLLIDIRSTNASAAEFILDRLKLYLAGRHHHQIYRYLVRVGTLSDDEYGVCVCVCVVLAYRYM